MIIERYFTATLGTAQCECGEFPVAISLDYFGDLRNTWPIGRCKTCGTRPVLITSLGFRKVTLPDPLVDDRVA